MLNRGFTLIEILVVIGILTVIIAFGMTINLSAFTSGTLQSEESKIVSILQRARSHAMANMFASSFTVCYVSSNYVISHDGICDGSGTDEIIPANTNIATTSNFSTNFDASHAVVFNQLDGTTIGVTINVKDSVKTLPITINNEGTINW